MQSSRKNFIYLLLLFFIVILTLSATAYRYVYVKDFVYFLPEPEEGAPDTTVFEE